MGEEEIKEKRPCRNLKISFNARRSIPKLEQSKPELHPTHLQLRNVIDGSVPLVPRIPDRDFPENQVLSAISRFATEMPSGDQNTLEEFWEFARRFIERLWPLGVEPDDVPNFKQWLESCNYSGGRKRALFDLRKDLSILELHGRDAYHVCQSFVKHETYPTYKAPRAINSLSDISKTIVGPLCKAIDTATFKSRFFVKGSNPKTWPERLEELFGGVPVLGTDFTAFESHHTGVFARIVKHWMMHMVRRLPNAKLAKDMIHLLCDMRNVCKFKHITCEVDQRLMSGAMWTSSANGVLNLIINAFLAVKAVGTKTLEEQVRWAVEDFKGVFEGDDGLSVDYGQCPKLIESLGLVLVLERQPDYGEAGFCGIVCPRFNPQVAKDPQGVLENFFWLAPRYASWSRNKQLGLLRAKAMSYKYTFGDCPIIGALCDWALYRTRSVTARWECVNSTWRCVSTEIESGFDHGTRAQVRLASRTIVDRRFGISVDQQLSFEKAFEASWSRDICRIPGTLGDARDEARHRERYLADPTRPFVRPVGTPAARRLLELCRSVIEPQGVTEVALNTRKQLKRHVVEPELDLY